MTLTFHENNSNSILNKNVTHTRKFSLMFLASFLAVLLLTSIVASVPFASAEIDDANSEKLEKIEQGFKKIRSSIAEQRTDNVSSMSFEFRTIGNALVGIQPTLSLEEQENLISEFNQLLTMYKKQTTKNEQVSKHFSSHEKQILQKLTQQDRKSVV